MPPASAYKTNDRELRQAADDELRKRRELSDKAWKYYEGQHRRHLKTMNGVDDNVTVNLVRECIDRRKAFLFPEMPGLELERLRETPAEKWLRDAWMRAGGARLLLKAAKYGCLEGHIFVRVMQGDAESGGYPRLVVLNPANVSVFWQADDVERVLWYELHWKAGETNYRQDVVRDGEGGGWLIVEYEQKPGLAWSERRRDYWTAPLGPIVDWQHLDNPRGYFGEGEVGAQGQNLALNDRVNRTASDMSRILRFHASPHTVGIGFSSPEVTETAVDGLWTIPNPDAQVFNLEMKSDLAASLNTLDYMTRAYLAERRIVVLKGDISDFQRVTNLALRALFVDMIAANAELQRQYEIGIQELSRRMLMLGGHDFANPPVVHWPDPLPSDPKETVETLEKERSMGVLSKETAAHQLGRDWDLERERMQDEAEDALMRMLRAPAPNDGNAPPQPPDHQEGMNVPQPPAR